MQKCHGPHLNPAKLGSLEVRTWQPLPRTSVTKPGYPCPSVLSASRNLAQVRSLLAPKFEGRFPAWFNTHLGVCVRVCRYFLPQGWEQGPSLALAISFGWLWRKAE